MTGEPVSLGPFKGGLNNSAGQGDYLKDDELYELVNLEVDTDGSLVNRPPVMERHITGATNVTSLGVYTNSTGNSYFVIKYTDSSSKERVGLINTSDTGNTVSLAASKEIKAGCVIQYLDRLYVIPYPGSGDTGGYFSSGLGWTDVSSLPEGQTAAIYVERMWIGAGADATSQTSLVRFSAIGDPSSWGANDNFNVNAGDGQNVTAIVVVFNDLFIFKNHSTYRVTVGANVLQAQRSTISTSIGTPNTYTVTLYNNRSLYLYHNEHVYELYNYNYTNVSTAISSIKEEESNISPLFNVSLSIFSDRLFFTYYGKLYVLSLLSGKWCSWEVNILPDTSTMWGIMSAQKSDGELAFASRTKSGGDLTYIFTSDKTFSSYVLSDDSLKGKIVTKTYDFKSSWAYKVAFWFGATAATSSELKFQVTVPNIGSNYTWDDWSAYTWDDLYNNSELFWDNNTNVSYEDSVQAGLGRYARKMYKLKKKLRFRQLYITVETTALKNVSGSDSMIRLYDLTAFVNIKERVVKELS